MSIISCPPPSGKQKLRHSRFSQPAEAAAGLTLCDSLFLRLDAAGHFVYPENMNKLSAAFLVAALLLPACQQQQQQQQKTGSETATERKVAPPLHIGAVHQVYPEQGFALLRIIGPMPRTGTTLITHPPDGSNTRLGNLCISSQQPTRDRVIAADIRSGTILKGDRVFLYRDISQQEEDEEIRVIDAPTEEPEAPPTILGDPGTGDTEDEPSGGELPTNGGVETTVLPTTTPTGGGSGSKGSTPTAPTRAPGYLNDIPDNIDDWD